MLILGAGLMGSALAYHLSRAGGLRVLVYDEAYPTAGASGKGAGIVSAQCWDPWDVRVVEETREEYRELSRRHGHGGYQENGSVRVVSRSEELPVLRERERTLRTEGVPARWLEPVELAAAVPALDPRGLLAGLLTPKDAVVDPPEMVFLYAELAQRQGVEFTWGWGFEGLERSPSGWTVRTRGGELSGRELVLASGAATKRLAASCGASLPLAPYRTQACRLLRETGGDSFPSVHDTATDVYVRPSAGGSLVAGDGTELTESDPDRYNPGADFSFYVHLAETFRDRFPGWASSRLARGWAGLCVATPDRRPLVGRVASVPHLLVACGFNGFGVMRAGALASRLAREMTDGPRDLLSPCDPARFPPEGVGFAPRPGFTLES